MRCFSKTTNKRKYLQCIVSLCMKNSPTQSTSSTLCWLWYNASGAVAYISANSRRLLTYNQLASHISRVERKQYKCRHLVANLGINTRWHFWCVFCLHRFCYHGMRQYCSCFWWLKHNNRHIGSTFSNKTYPFLISFPMTDKNTWVFVVVNWKSGIQMRDSFIHLSCGFLPCITDRRRVGWLLTWSLTAHLT